MPDQHRPPNEPFKSGPWRSRGYLPHFEEASRLQFITIRLADSLPREALLRLEASVPARMSAERREAVEALLDKSCGACWLRRPDVASLVEGSLLHWDKVQFHLLAWVVMPNHVHWLMEPFAGLSRILAAIKSYTARQANALIGRSGEFWQREYFDRAIRDQRQLVATVEYIHNSPVKAGLCRKLEQWRFSSAFGDRQGELPL